MGPGPKTVTDIARETGMGNSTAYKLLETLQLMGYVERTPFTTYKLGVALVRLASSYLSDQNGFVAIAEPHLRKLNQLTGETIHLGIRDESHVIYLSKLESTQVVRMHSKVGDKSPLYCTGLGKAILARMAEDELDEYLSKAELVRYTDTTLTTPADIRNEIEKIRNQGYSIDNSEHTEDIRCIAISLQYSNRQCGAMSISAPKYRMDDDTLLSYLPQLLRARDEILQARS